MCRCTCGAMDPNIGKALNRFEEPNPLPCWGWHATVAHPAAATTSTILDLSLWRTSALYRLIIRGSTESSLSCVASAARHSQYEAIGEPTKRTVVNFGSVHVARISSTSGHWKITSGLSETATLLTESTLAKTTKTQSPKRTATKKSLEALIDNLSTLVLIKSLCIFAHMSPWGTSYQSWHCQDRDFDNFYCHLSNRWHQYIERFSNLPWIEFVELAVQVDAEQPSNSS